MTAADAAHSAMLRQLALARRGRSWIQTFTGRRDGLQPWAHHPAHDAIDASGRWQFYFHAHPAVAEDHAPLAGEQGHVHLFRRDGCGALSHLAGLSLDARGAPLQWFMTNRWVTGGRWLTPRDAARALQARPTLRLRGPLCGVALWLGDLLRLYQGPLLGMLQRRDEALKRHCASQGLTPRQARNDRRIALWQRLPIDWPQDALDAMNGAAHFQIPEIRQEDAANAREQPHPGRISANAEPLHAHH